MRILVAFEYDYHTYADVLAKAIRAARPHLNVVATVGLEVFQAGMELLDPHLLICSSSFPAPPKQQQEEGTLLLTWVQLSVDPHLPSKFCVSGRRWESSNPSLEELLDVIEETERLLLSSNSRQSGLTEA